MLISSIQFCVSGGHGFINVQSRFLNPNVDKLKCFTTLLENVIMNSRWFSSLKKLWGKTKVSKSGVPGALVYMLALLNTLLR